jgi:SAM-dependent methyltransferase
MLRVQIGNVACRICRNSLNNRFHQAKEMFYGTRESFIYIECASCGTLQIDQVPELSRFYPQNYYSYKPLNDVDHSKQMSLKERLVRRMVANYYGNRRNLLGRYIVKSRDWVSVGFPEYIKNTKVRLGINTNSRILDIGCGAGYELLELHRYMFRNLTGVDLFIPSDIHYKNGVKIIKAALADIKDQFDLIMMHHSFEHIPSPHETLKHIKRILKRGKYALICIPLATYAWRKYGTNWVQLDAPRHLYLFSEKSFSKLAEDAGFKVDEVMYNSTEFQFWGSEQYLQNIPLVDERSYDTDPNRSIFTTTQISEFTKRATELNRRREGDQAIFYLRKI